MHTVPVLRLNACQVAQLIGYCTGYRSYLWQSVMPTPERNQTIRSIQALQAKLEKAQEQGQAEMSLCLTEEEKNTLKLLLNEVIRLYGNAPPSAQRMQQLTEVAGLRIQLERAFRQTQTL